MKKKLFCLLFALLLVLVSAGCGMDRSGARPGTDTEILPDSTPMVSPDMNDGVVRDQDGIIGNGDMGSHNPSPSASPVPSASPMPTTAPSTSPKP